MNLSDQLTWWHVIKIAAQTQAPEIPLPEAFWRKELAKATEIDDVSWTTKRSWLYLLKSWWGPVQDPQTLSVSDLSECCSSRVDVDPVRGDESVVDSTIFNASWLINSNYIFLTMMFHVKAISRINISWLCSRRGRAKMLQQALSVKSHQSSLSEQRKSNE